MPKSKEAPVYFTARHLLQALQHLDAALLDMPIVLIHGKELQKPNLIQGFLPTPTPIEQEVVENKNPSLLTLGYLTSLQ
jgi:hypothetical protein